MRWCDRNGVDYVLGLARNPVLEKQAAPFMAAAQAQFSVAHEKVRNFHEIQYGAQTWDRQRRVIVKAERLVEGPNLRFIVTSLTERTPAELYDGLYVQRGEMENRIKEQQLALFADRTSCHAFLANQFRLLLSSAAYVLVEHVRRTALADTELAQAQAETIRRKLIKVAARVVVSFRRVLLQFSSAYPLQALFARVLQKLGSHAELKPAPS